MKEQRAGSLDKPLNNFRPPVPVGGQFALRRLQELGVWLLAHDLPEGHAQHWSSWNLGHRDSYPTLKAAHLVNGSGSRLPRPKAAGSQDSGWPIAENAGHEEPSLGLQANCGLAWGAQAAGTGQRPSNGDPPSESEAEATIKPEGRDGTAGKLAGKYRGN